MPGAYVQAQKVDTSGTSGGIPITLTGGNNVYVWIRSGGGTISSVTDTLGNTYLPITRDGSNNWPLIPDADGDSVAIYEALNVIGGATTITITTSGSTTQRHIAIEFSGLTITTAVDKAALTDNQQSATPTSGVTVTRTQADEVLLGCISTGDAHTYAAVGGFTKALAETTKSAVEYQVVSIVGTDAATWSLNSADTLASFTIATITTLKAASTIVPTPQIGRLHYVMP